MSAYIKEGGSLKRLAEENETITEIVRVGWSNSDWKTLGLKAGYSYLICTNPGNNSEGILLNGDFVYRKTGTLKVTEDGTACYYTDRDHDQSSVSTLGLCCIYQFN